MSNTASTEYSNQSHVCPVRNVRADDIVRQGVFGTGMGILCFLFFLGTMLFCSCAGPRFPSASQSPKDPYAENGPKTKEEEAYYQDVYSGEWREQTGPFGFAKSIGKKSGSKTMPPHWAMMPHGAKTMSEIKTETAMRQSDRLAYNNYTGAPGQAMNASAYNPVSMAPAPYTQVPAPAAGVPGTAQYPQTTPGVNQTPNYIAPTYHGQGQFVSAVVERPAMVDTAAKTTVPPYNTSPQNTQNPPYAQPPVGAPQGQQIPATTGATLPPVRFPVEYQPQTTGQNNPAVKTSETVPAMGTPAPATGTTTAAVTGNVTPFLPPTGTAPVSAAPAATQNETAPQKVSPAQTTPEAPIQTPFPQFNGFSSPVSYRSESGSLHENTESSCVFFSRDMIIRGQAPATAKPDTAKPDTAKPDTAKPDKAKPDTAKPDQAKPDQAKSDTVKADSVPMTSEAKKAAPPTQGTDDLFDSPAAAPAAVSKVSDTQSQQESTQVSSGQGQTGTSENSAFSERLGGRPLPLKFDPKLETTWKSLSRSTTSKTAVEVESKPGVAQSGRFLPETCPGTCPEESGKLPPYVSAKKACPKYGRDGKAVPGYAPYEYIMDGSDSKGEAYATPDWNVHHLDQEDTIAHFDTIDGRILVEPSNRVCIYSPRFGSVRQIIGLRESDQNLLLHNAETALGAVSSSKLAAVDVRSQEEKVKHTLVETRLSGMAAKDLGHSMSGEVAVMENDQETRLGDMMSLIRLNTMSDKVKASLAKGMQAAQNWGSMESVKIAVGEVFATANTYANSPMTMYHVENGTKSAKLRLIKIASKDAAQPGELIEFVLRYENVGDQVIGNVTLLDNLSSRLVYVDASAKSSRKGEFLVKENKQGSVVLRWEITEPLKPGEFGVVEFICKVR